jgi:hypothetical protein
MTLISKVNFWELLRKAYVDALRGQQSQRYPVVEMHGEPTERTTAQHSKRQKTEERTSRKGNTSTHEILKHACTFNTV